METVWRVLIIGLTIGAIYALIAIGLNLMWGTMRLLNIAHGDIIMLGGYTAYWLFTLFGLSPLISCILAGLGAAVIGLIVYKLLFAASIRKTKFLESLEANSLLIFFGVLIILENVALLLWKADIRGYNYLTESIYLFGVPIAANRLVASLVAIGICLAFYLFLQKTLFGKAIRAVIQDKEATQIVGVNTSTIYVFCFAMSFALAGLSGALISMFFTVTPFVGLSYTMMAFIVVILGGLGNILGSLIAGLLIGVATTLVVSFTTPGYTYIVQYMLFILVILFMPQGIFTRKR